MTSRNTFFTLALLVMSLAWAAASRADVRPLETENAQTLTRPASPVFTTWGQDVAVDGGHIIVLAAYNGGQQALLYRRSASNGQWVFRRALVTWTGPFVRGSVAMRNGIAAVQFSDQISLFELSGGDYVAATSAAPIRHHGGVAISGGSVLIGGNNCDYDAVIYQKNGAGSWAITGRIDDNQGECFAPFDSYALELNYDYALLFAPNARAAQAWRRNGTALEWIPSGTLALLPAEGATTGDWALQGTTAVASNGVVWRRSGAATWTRQGEIVSVDRDDGYGITFEIAYRDGVLVASESDKYLSFPRVYIEASPGRFEHVASMPFLDATGAQRMDVSGRTAVVSARDYDGSRQLVRVYNLPAPLRAQVPVVNDFEDRDVSDFTFTGGQFAVATRGTDDVLTQNATSGLGIALLNDTDWTDHQRVEADITPTSFSGANSYVGLVARYVDANNYYYLAIRGNETYGVYKRVNGVDTLLYSEALYNPYSAPYRAVLRARGNKIDFYFNFQQGRTVTDNSLTHGRGGLVTSAARADFDDVQVAATDQYNLFSRNYNFTGYDYESGMTELSGDWFVPEGGDEENSFPDGLQQRDSSGSAVAIVGTPVPNVDIRAPMRLDSYAASRTGAWFGLLARYTDARNHYYVTVRATGQIDIRKIVDGVITVLASANYTAVPGQYFNVRFLLINDQLQLYLNDVLVATAHDRSLASGKYGIATYRAAATWNAYSVVQP